MSTGPHTYRYRVVDVFTQHPLEGNQLAVFTDARGLDVGTMQKIARELNLSETIFIFPATRADCAAAVRIFTPGKEMMFAGHPTIGVSFVLWEEKLNRAEAFTLEEKIGPVPIRVERGDGGRPLIWLTTPRISFDRVLERGACASALGLSLDRVLEVPPQVVTAGNPAIFVPVRTPADVDQAWIDMAGMHSLKLPKEEPMCVYVFAPTPQGAYSRMFAPEYGIVEDPATGSLAGPLAAYMLRNHLTPASARWFSEQGTKMKRRSFLHVNVRGENQIDVGGYVTSLVEATMTLPAGAAA
jgi:trans-2,3-dihydro-3-hydroxyanthranilate isomerase